MNRETSRSERCDTGHTPPGADVSRRRPADEDLARRARLGDKQAFGELAARHGPAMYRFAHRMLRDTAAGEDCVQDAFLAAWTSLDRFRGDSAVRTWLFGILANTIRRRVRTEARHPADELPDELPTGASADPATTVQAQDLLGALELALTELPPAQRACWILAEVERMSYADIARIQATTVGSVRGAVHRARQSLERRLEPWR